MARGDIQLQIAQSSGGGQIPLSEVGGSTDGAGPFTPGALSPVQWQQLGLDWWSQREQHAIAVLNDSTVQVDSPKRFDFTMWPPLLAGTTPPTVDLTRNGTVYEFAGVSDASIQYSANPGTGLIASAQTQSYYAATQVETNGAGPIAGEIVLLGLINPSAPSEYIKIGNNAFFGVDSQWRLWMESGGVVSPGFSLGPNCVAGGALTPDGAPFTIGVRFDLKRGALVVEVQDEEVLRLVPNTGDLNRMPTTNLQLFTSQNTGATGFSPLLSYGGFAMIQGARR